MSPQGRPKGEYRSAQREGVVQGARRAKPRPEGRVAARSRRPTRDGRNADRCAEGANGMRRLARSAGVQITQERNPSAMHWGRATVQMQQDLRRAQ